MTDVLVIGGGLAGSAAAIHLARAGRSVTLYERTAGPHHKVCGEFLSREAVRSLGELGIQVSALGAVPIHSVRFGGHSAALPFVAQSLSRYVLDEALLQAAIRAGVTVKRGHTAHVPGDSSTQTVFLANGKHDLSGQQRPPGAQSDLIGFKMYFRLAADQQQALSGFIELTPFPGGYCGLQCIEENRANLCLLIRRQTLRSLNGRWPQIVRHATASSELLRQRLVGAEPLWSTPLAISPIPYGYRCRTMPAHQWPLGDQAAVIPSFAGNGMSIALRSAEIASGNYLQGRSSTDYLTQLNRQVRRPVALATRISQLLVRPWPAGVMQTAAQMWPGLLPQVAVWTRLP